MYCTIVYEGLACLSETLGWYDVSFYQFIVPHKNKYFECKCKRLVCVSQTRTKSLQQECEEIDHYFCLQIHTTTGAKTLIDLIYNLSHLKAPIKNYFGLEVEPMVASSCLMTMSLSLSNFQIGSCSFLVRIFFLILLGTIFLWCSTNCKTSVINSI